MPAQCTGAGSEVIWVSNAPDRNGWELMYLPVAVAVVAAGLGLRRPAAKSLNAPMAPVVW
ncbi:hypothetical protein [Corynebacterium sp. H130]|uniref:hypothetical protein n=1 Tax=Corynebacterium sp. H130 TaxID=3133444 RepID=UPI003097542D